MKGNIHEKKVLAAILLAVGVLTGCGNSEPISSPIQTVEAEPIATDTKEVEQPAATESSADEVAPEHSYRSELTNEWIDEDLKDQRPIAVMVDNERTALPHFGTADADVVYEIMNSTLNDRITRFMVVVKDWEKIEQLGSIRSARPTNFMLAAEWNAVLCHDGGPYFINDWVAKIIPLTSVVVSPVSTMVRQLSLPSILLMIPIPTARRARPMTV